MRSSTIMIMATTMSAGTDLCGRSQTGTSRLRVDRPVFPTQRHFTDFSIGQQLPVGFKRPQVYRKFALFRLFATPANGPHMEPERGLWLDRTCPTLLLRMQP
jgi:hypothetical protein